MNEESGKPPVDGVSESEHSGSHALAMETLNALRRIPGFVSRRDDGRLFVFISEGRGSSLSAFGMAARALGWGITIGILQFSRNSAETGERRFFQALSHLATFETCADRTGNQQSDAEAMQDMWNRAQEVIIHPGFQVVILDELCTALRNGLLDRETVM